MIKLVLRTSSLSPDLLQTLITKMEAGALSGILRIETNVAPELLAIRITDNGNCCCSMRAALFEFATAESIDALVARLQSRLKEQRRRSI